MATEYDLDRGDKAPPPPPLRVFRVYGVASAENDEVVVEAHSMSSADGTLSFLSYCRTKDGMAYEGFVRDAFKVWTRVEEIRGMSTDTMTAN